MSCKECFQDPCDNLYCIQPPVHLNKQPGRKEAEQKLMYIARDFFFFSRPSGGLPGHLSHSGWREWRNKTQPKGWTLLDLKDTALAVIYSVLESWIYYANFYFANINSFDSKKGNNAWSVLPTSLAMREILNSSWVNTHTHTQHYQHSYVHKGFF